MPRPAALVSLLALLAAGCAAGPDYRPPAGPDGARGDFVSAPADAVAALPDAWWKLYDDPVLDGLVERAFAANTDLRVAAANLEKARAVLGGARAGRLPTTDLSGGANYGNAVQIGTAATSGTTSSAQTYGYGTATMAWEVDLLGRVGRTIEAARADAEAMAAARDGVRVAVAAETTRAYLDACASAMALDVAAQGQARAKATLDLVTRQEKAGAASRLDVERAGAAEAAARAALPAWEGDRRAALLELAALLGSTPGSIPEEATSCMAVPAPRIAIPVGDGEALLRRRPDLRQAERELAAQTARIGVATAELYPRISLGASGNWYRSGDVKGSDSFSFAVGPLVSWSFPNIAGARSRLRQERAEGDAALARFDGSVLTALKEVEQALVAVATGERRLAALGEARARSERAFALAEARYRAGSLAYLDVLEAQASMLEARSQHVAALRSLSDARVDLFKALGGGWQ